MNILLLQRTLNNFVGEGYGYIPGWVFRNYSVEDWSIVEGALRDWEIRKFLIVEKDPRACDMNEICIKMLNFVEATEPMPTNWINYERTPPLWRNRN